MSEQKVYKVQSVYRTTGTSYIVATSAAEAQRIGREGYADGSLPQFVFSDPWGETNMLAVPARDTRPSLVEFPNGTTGYPPIDPRSADKDPR